MSRWLAIVGLSSLLFSTTAASGQTPRAERHTCWTPTAASDCRAHWVAEVRGLLPVASTATQITTESGVTAGSSTFGPELEWELGYLLRLSEGWSLGPTVAIGTGAHPGVLRGIRLRGRRWYADSPMIDLEGGYVRSDGNGTRSAAHGAYVGVRLLPHPFLGLGAHAEWLAPTEIELSAPVGFGISASTSGVPALITTGGIGLVALVVGIVVGMTAS